MHQNISKKKSIIIIILFLLMTTGFTLVWPVAKNYVDTENHEKREFAEKPTFNLASISTYPSAFEDYFNDHIPFRNQLINANTDFEYVAFNETQTTQVTVGEEGWLYYTDPSDGDSIRSYQGRDLLTEQELATIASNMLETKKNLEAAGTEFVILLIPNKERVYSEYMPSSYGEPAEEYGLLQIYNYLKENTDINVVYCYDELMAAKEELGEETLLYYKTDSHWNPLGAYIGAKAVFDSLGVEFPAYNSAQIHIESRDASHGDLAELLNLDMDDGTEFYPVGYYENGFYSDELDFEGISRMHTATGAQKLYMRHDSFGTNLAPYVASAFAETVMVHHNVGNAEFVYAEEPDVFILETVERYAKDSLLNWYLTPQE